MPRVAIDPVVGFAMVLAVIGAGMASLGMQAQQPAYLRAAGMPGEFAAALLGLTAAGSLIGSLTIGPVLDRFRGQVSSLLVSATFYLGLLTLYSLLGVSGREFAIVGSMLFGYAFGAGEVMWITLTKRQFGVAAFPVAYGASTSHFRSVTRSATAWAVGGSNIFAPQDSLSCSI